MSSASGTSSRRRPLRVLPLLALLVVVLAVRLALDTLTGWSWLPSFLVAGIAGGLAGLAVEQALTRRERRAAG